MRIIHRISTNINDAMLSELAEFGIKVNVGLATFEVDEAHPSWSEIEAWIPKVELLDVVRTEFSKIEIRSAEVLRMAATWQHGFPEPSDDMDYLKETYVEKSTCKKCGSGKVQQRPFRLRQEPKWGNKQVLQLNWVFDEFFVQPDVWRQVFQPFGIACREVVHARSEKPLETIVQLCIDEIATTELVLDGSHEITNCEACGVAKYRPIVRGEFPSLRGELKSSIVKTIELFGSGASAWRAVLVSSELFRSVELAKIKGVEFVPTVKNKSKVSS